MLLLRIALCNSLDAVMDEKLLLSLWLVFFSSPQSPKESSIKILG